MKASSECMLCLLGKQRQIIAGCQDEEKKREYLKRVFLRMGQIEEKDSAPVLNADICRIAEEVLGKTVSYEKEKAHFNGLMLSLLPEVEKRIRKQEDSLEAAIKYARAGNYIDFGAMPDVKEEKLMELLERAMEEPLTAEVYEELKADLERAKRLVYVTDNCGEVVMDMALIILIKEAYPEIAITVLVRGEEALNDATTEDAALIGLDKIVEVKGNGCDVPGTAMHRISEESVRLLKKADVVISKGQGNLETLYGGNDGLNVYYLFLCKCDWFTKKFGVKKYTGVFMHEQQKKSFL